MSPHRIDAESQGVETIIGSPHLRGAEVRLLPLADFRLLEGWGRGMVTLVCLEGGWTVKEEGGGEGGGGEEMVGQ